MANDKTEKATPKKKEDARKKGQVARSQDVNGAAILLASILALNAFGPKIMEQCKLAMVQVIDLMKTPQVVDQKGIGELFMLVGQHIMLAALPVMAICLVAGFLSSAAQVGLKPMPGAMKPEFKKINPVSGFKNLFNPQHFAVETVKNIMKTVAVGAIAAMAVFPKLDEFAALVGTPPQDIVPEIASLVMTIATRAAMAYLFIAALDFAWQKHKHEKSLKMDKEELKQEFKQQELPAEIKSQQRRRAMEMSRSRMMDSVPTADVIVTNPTHFAVALKYESGSSAPIVVAKGVDNLAHKIREAAKDAGVMIVPDPPLARTLYANVEIGRQIPEDLFHAVAQLLAYVYRVAGLRSAAA
ncbi:flagellar biosynthesis protein FlhB [Solirubrobacter sp. CPCC 204708]|uniref:Flagellar biosynthetic protein FlhB n=1 Tax=Solirubrobacter deserti TaxID=2282478 RepID=A0ABT4RME6_9ACTN|nr:flagellar biosynthesis protein FlhB [Solirubrobacter deserti]MBE2316912.1 flagellar biosynthesis protein FlhB [Solirubrobacter deserti]MDA0139743.1 flagellar biosynthesis protein FlhB [Solirubrobacter deserti]